MTERAGTPRRLRIVLILGWVAVLIATLAALPGCATTPGGPPAASLGAVLPDQSRQLSPPVHYPRDIRAFGDRPCELFTVAQLAAFGFDRPPDSTDTLTSGNKTCVRIDRGYTARLAVIVYPDWDILERVYLNRAMAGVFTPTQVAGLPAVAHQSAPGMPGCYLTVGLAARQGLEVTFTDLREPPDDPCGAARTAADVAIMSLPRLAGS